MYIYAIMPHGCATSTNRSFLRWSANTVVMVAPYPSFLDCLDWKPSSVRASPGRIQKYPTLTFRIRVSICTHQCRKKSFISALLDRFAVLRWWEIVRSLPKRLTTVPSLD